MNYTDTIVAISTPVGLGAVGIVRLSGENALAIARKMFSSSKIKDEVIPNVLYLGTLSFNGLSDKALMVYFKAPKSFTGEDIVEFQCHGGRVILENALKGACALGARLATNGEFSRRAFLNGKMDLANVEGMADMINAESEVAQRLAYSQFKGKVSEEVSSLQEELENVIAYVEASFDYPEEDMPAMNVPEVVEVLTSQIKKVEKLVSTFTLGNTLKNGVSVAIVGQPNVGKSSLLNAILGFDRAIVTDIAGTTRDVLTSSYIYKGLKINLSDTAGIRESSDVIEQIGVDLARKTVSSADIVLAVFDGNKPLTKGDLDLIKTLPKNRSFIAINKADLELNLDKSALGGIDVITISAKTGEGIEDLKEKIYSFANASNVLSTESAIISSERQILALKEALSSLKVALNSIEYLSADLLIIDIRRAWEKYGEITGTTASEHIVDTIFSKLCLGK